jgi:hypothetical protein
MIYHSFQACATQTSKASHRKSVVLLACLAESHSYNVASERAAVLMLGVLTYSTEREVLSWHIELREAVEE